MMTEEKAKEYIKKHAEPHGLTWECLQYFDNDVSNHWRVYKKEPDHLKLANDALYEWDI